MSTPTPAPYPPERSLWRADSPRTAGPLSAGTPAELARVWLWVIGGVLTVAGAVSAIAGRVAKIAAYANFSGTAPNDHIVPGADTADSWLYAGIVALLLGVTVLLVQLFLFAYLRRDASPDGPRD